MTPIQGNPGEIHELARYEVWQEAEHPTRFVHLFVWRDEEANRVHGESAAVKKFAGILYPKCLAPVEFIEYSRGKSSRRHVTGLQAGVPCP